MEDGLVDFSVVTHSYGYQIRRGFLSFAAI